GSRSHGEDGGAEQHEEPAPEAVDPGPDEWLADDAGAAVNPPHHTDGSLRADQLMDVEGQENEAVEAAEEEEGGQHGPRERATDHGDERGDHARCGGFRASARMPDDPMRRGEYSIVPSSRPP